MVVEGDMAVKVAGRKKVRRDVTRNLGWFDGHGIEDEEDVFNSYSPRFNCDHSGPLCSYLTCTFQMHNYVSFQRNDYAEWLCTFWQKNISLDSSHGF